ncbi:transposase [Streptomyces sp. NPDC050421]|uniref:transposase n=1 Tax=unclassified Streptomyces TaxID=2593676 RepID=UPI003798ED2E
MDHPPRIQLPELANSLKGVSSRYLRQEFTGHANRAVMHGRSWSPSYVAGSCDGAPLSSTSQNRLLRPSRESSHGITFPPGPKAGIPCEDGGWPIGPTHRPPHRKRKNTWHNPSGTSSSGCAPHLCSSSRRLRSPIPSTSSTWSRWTIRRCC